MTAIARKAIKQSHIYLTEVLVVYNLEATNIDRIGINSFAIIHLTPPPKPLFPNKEIE